MKNSKLDLWLADLTQCHEHLDECYRILSPNEKERADRFKVTHAREQYVAAHYVKRTVLSTYLSVNKSDVKFIFNEFKKPFIDPVHQSNLVFNLSHAKKYAVIAVADAKNVGVDIEYMDSKATLLDIAKRFFDPSEFQLIQTSQDPIKTFYQLWSCKESFLKAIGKGLHASTIHTVFNKDYDIISSDETTSLENFQVITLDNVPDYSVAVTVETLRNAPTQTLNVHEWTWPGP